jgi:hypothetical protein
MSELASLGDLKEHLNITDSSSDVELRLMLNAAQEVARSIVGDWSFASTVTETVSVVGGTAILGQRPSGPVLAGGRPIGGNVDRSAGLVTDIGGTYSMALPYRITVSYPADANAVPQAVTLGTLIIAANLWETQRGSQPLPLQGGAEDPTPSGTYAPLIPARARELLEPFARRSQVA